jgi:ABC-type dipeptide/oligopeptide/nickel transport system permease component
MTVLKNKNQSWNIKGKHFILPVTFLFFFMAIAVTLWLTRDNLFYLFNFSYIGLSVAIGLFLTAVLPKRIRHRGRLVTQFLYGHLSGAHRQRKYAD